MEYRPLSPKTAIYIEHLYSIHYFEYLKNYYYPGERHDFWELVYVDRGEIIASVEWAPGPQVLRQGDVLLYRPGEFHSFYGNGITAHNLMVISFSCRSPAMEHFMEHPFAHLDAALARHLNKILQEAKRAFSVPLGEASTRELLRAQGAPFGGEQMICMRLSMLLIELIRQGQGAQNQAPGPAETEEKLSDHYVSRAIGYLRGHLASPVQLEDVCRHVNISRSQLQKVFRRKTGNTVMHYLAVLRMEEAKYRIRCRDVTFTELSQELGYKNVHHFSRQFHSIVGMSPSEYMRSIRAMDEYTLQTYGEKGSV